MIQDVFLHYVNHVGLQTLLIKKGSIITNAKSVGKRLKKLWKKEIIKINNYVKGAFHAAGR